MPMGTIAIAHARFSLSTRAMICGKFAAHPPAGDRQWPKGGIYTITHIASGRLVCIVRGRKNATLLARRLDKALTFDVTPDDWTPTWNDRYCEFYSTVRSVIALFLTDHPEAEL